VDSVKDPYGSILGFLDRSHYFFFQVAPQLDTVLDPLLLRKFDSAGNRKRTSESVARNSDHWITEAVYFTTVRLRAYSDSPANPDDVRQRNARNAQIEVSVVPGSHLGKCSYNVLIRLGTA
jgi:hypothetical protein